MLSIFNVELLVSVELKGFSVPLFISLLPAGHLSTDEIFFGFVSWSFSWVTNGMPVSFTEGFLVFLMSWFKADMLWPFSKENNFVLRFPPFKSGMASGKTDIVGFEVDVVGIGVVGFGLVDVTAPKWF